MLQEWLQNFEERISDESNDDLSEIEKGISSMLNSIDEAADKFMDALDKIYAE